MLLYNFTSLQVVAFPDKRTERPTAHELSNLGKYLGWEADDRLVLASSSLEAVYHWSSQCWTALADRSKKELEDQMPNIDWKRFRFNQIPIVNEVDIPETNSPSRLEKQHVIDVYDQVAQSFDKTRLKEWGRVKDFLDKVPPNSSVADIGCGNGRHMVLGDDLNFTGCDASQSMVTLCQKRGLNAVVGNVLELPFCDSSFDFVISIAVIHHLASSSRRMEAIGQLVRIVKPGGLIMIQVWSFEQSPRSRFKFTSPDSFVEWRTGDSSHQRFYHLFQKGELRELVERLEVGVEVVEEFNDCDNWGVILKKRTI